MRVVDHVSPYVLDNKIFFQVVLADDMEYEFRFAFQRTPISSFGGLILRTFLFDRDLLNPSEAFRIGSDHS